MREQIEFLKKALNRSPTAGPFGCYHIYNGVAYAQNETMQSSVPLVLGADFSAPGAELETALARMSSDPSVSFTDGVLALKAGRLSATVPCTAMEPPPLYEAPVGGQWADLPDNFLAALKAGCPFIIGPQQGWANTIRLADGRLTVINNRCGIDVAIPGLECPSSLLTKELAEFLLSCPPPARYATKPKTAFLFEWDDGRSVHMQLVDSEMPAKIDQIFAAAGQDAPIAITPDWRAAYEDAAAIAESFIEVRADSISVGKGTSRVTIDAESGLPHDHVSYWETKLLTPMVAVATHWNPGAYPKAALFKGPALYGLVLGLKR